MKLNKTAVLCLIGVLACLLLPWHALPDELNLLGYFARFQLTNSFTLFASVLNQLVFAWPAALCFVLMFILSFFTPAALPKKYAKNYSQVAKTPRALENDPNTPHGATGLQTQALADIFSTQTFGRILSIFSFISLLLLGTNAAQGTQALGWGAFVAIVVLLILLACGMAYSGFFRGDAFVASAVICAAALLAVFIAWPVCKALAGAFFNEANQFAFSAFWQRFAHNRIWNINCLTGGASCGVAWNTVFLALATATGTTLLGLILALLAERGLHGKLAKAEKGLRLLALMPIITPPFVVGLGLILLFGRAGLVNQFLEFALGIPPSRWFYGVQGIWIAQMFAFTPIAFLMLRGVVQGISPSMEEAAQTLRANPSTTFFTITLPLLKPGITSAFLVGFIESLADFGNPIVVGGQYAVLSTEIFFAIVGAQLDQGRAAALAFLLALFALGVFVLQRKVLGRANYTTVSGKGDGGVALALPSGVRKLALTIGGAWLLFTLIIYAFAFIGGFVVNWGRDYTPTLMHYKTAFDVQWGEFGLVWAGTAWASFFTTLKLAGLAAPITALAGILLAYLISRVDFKGRGVFEFVTLLAFAIPGTVLGVSYVLAFNAPPLELTGTGLIIMLSFLFRNLPVGIQAGTAAFKQIDKSLDEASLVLRANTWTTLRKITLPLLRPALVAALVYSFVRSITTISAVIFLVTAENELATTYIIGRVGNGDYGIALAYCTVLIVIMVAAMGAIQWLVGERQLGRRAVVVSGA